MEKLKVYYPSLTPIKWDENLNYLLLLDQRTLPQEEKWNHIKTPIDCYYAIQEMIVRGAPCIGFSGIFGLALWPFRKSENSQPRATLSEFLAMASHIKSARPTAVNLAFEIDRAVSLVRKHFPLNEQNDFTKEELIELGKLLVKMASSEIELSFERNLKMAKFVANDLHELYGDRPLNVITHCNTGYLACGTLGTALGVITYLHSQKRINHVYADETRPYLQGGRLTAYELQKQNIPFDIIVEGAASYIIKTKKVDAIFVGADRIVANGDTANKIGTSSLAIIAKHYNIPFYVVAPKSSFDLSLSSGSDIEIELRDPNEILSILDKRIAPKEATAINPSFDVTDSNLIRAIACEDGLITPNPSYVEAISSLF